MSLPKRIYVAERTERTSDPYLVAERTPGEAIEDDGPTVIGTYELVSTEKMAKKATKVR